MPQGKPFSEYPPNRRWDPSTADDLFEPPKNIDEEIVSWYDPKNAGPHYGNPPADWTEGQERNGLIHSILTLQRERRFLNEITSDDMAKWSNAKLEYVFGQMLLAAAEGRAPVKSWKIN